MNHYGLPFRRFVHAAALLLAITTMMAAEKDAKPASKPAKEAPAATRSVDLVARIAMVKGKARVQLRPDGPWIRARVGLEIGPGAELRTLFRSFVVLRIDPDQEIAIDRMTTVKILRAQRDPSKIMVDLIMKYGRTRYRFSAGAVPHESTIHAPNTTLAMRSTDGQVRAGDGFPASVTSWHGRVLASIAGRYQAMPMGGQIKTQVSSTHDTPASNARADSVQNATGAYAGLSDSEKDLLEGLPGLDTYQPSLLAALSNVFEPGFSGTGVGVPEFSTQLEFGMAWIPIETGLDTNLDLEITDPQARMLSATNTPIGSGSVIGMHTGDTNESNPVEVGFFAPESFSGTYQVSVHHRGGESPANVFLQVLQGSDPPTPIAVIGQSSPVLLNPGQTFNCNVNVTPNVPSVPATHCSN